MGWNTLPLEQLCEFKNGLWKGKKEPFVRVGVIRNTNFSSGGTLDDSNIAYLDVEAKQFQSRKLEFGDLILEKSGGGPKQPVGRVVPFEKRDGNYSFSNFTSVVRIKDKEKIHYSFLHKFLHYLYLVGETEPMQRQSTGIRNLQLKEYKTVSVPVPQFDEQKRIVAILDQAFADIDKARALTTQNLKNARELFDALCEKSIFSENHPPNCTVADVAMAHKGAIRTGPFGSQLLKKEIVDSGIAVLGIDNAVDNYFKWGAKRFITADKFEQLARFEVKPGDVLITIMGTCGRCAIVPSDIPKSINSKHICCITLDKSKCLPEYLHAYFLYHPAARSYLLSRAKGSIMAGLNMGIVKELPLVLPSIAEQQQKKKLTLC